ncbi:MAG TPA: hypothetical protein VLM38_17490 [Blastocatellia bacterium]|nr:hypothetical protein [Blastocatellia bacterium]
MRKCLLVFLVSIVVLAQTATADTIHLKNGSVLKGKVSSFADDQFVIMLDTGSGRYLSKAMVYMGDVARIEFDSAPAAASDAPAAAPEPSEPAPVISKTENQPRGKKGTTTAATQPAETQPKETGPPETQPPPTDPLPEKPLATNPPTATVPATTETSDSERLTRKPLVPVKTMNVDVAAKKDWTSSGLIVKRGDHIRITASGSITLDPVGGRTCGPEGVGDLADPKKLMPDQPTGALIGVISSDNDDFIFIGRSAEFTATRDGLLFLSVNEGQLSDNLGSFKATVEVLSQRK